MTTSNQKPVTRQDLRQFTDEIIGALRDELEARQIAQANKLDLKFTLQSNKFDDKLASERGEMDTKFKSHSNFIIESIQDELDSKLTAQRSSLVTELRTHTEKVVAAHSSEVLDAIANVVEPLEKRVTRLEAKVG